MNTLAILKMLNAIRLEVRALGYLQSGPAGTAGNLQREAGDVMQEAFRLEKWVQNQKNEEVVR